jgi:tetratricopeptide (TPR) repeat protein
MKKHPLISTISTVSILLALVITGYSADVTEVAVTTNSYDQSETAISVDPLDQDNLMIVWNDFYLFYPSNNWVLPGYAFSSDGGTTWSTSHITPDSSYLYGVDPSCAFDQSGYAYFCYFASEIKYDEGPLYVSRTANAGSTWTHFQAYDGEADKPYMAVDNTSGSYDGRIYVSWTDFEDDTLTIEFTYSANQGSTWSTPCTLVTAGDTSSAVKLFPKPLETKDEILDPFVQGSVPAVGPNGELYVVWVNSITSSIEMRKSTDGGATFGNIITVSDSVNITFMIPWGLFRISTLPTIAVDQNTGNIYVAYVEAIWEDPHRKQPQLVDLWISLVRSTDGGQNWSSPIIPTDTTFADSSFQFYPWLSVDPSGMVQLAYCDDRADPLDSVDVYLAESLDNGQSFYMPNRRITSVSMDIYDATWPSDYIGITSGAGHALLAWGDSRNGNSDIYFANVDYTKSGTIDGSETWDFYTLVTGDVTVQSGDILTLEPGTRVEFSTTDDQSSGEDSQKPELIVYGDLVADGTSSDDIVFTSIASSPAKADWYGIVLMDSSSTLDHCTISYADKGLHCYKCSLEINNLDISDCNYGAYVETTGTKLYLDSTSISDCSKGIHVDKGALRLTDCQLNGNSVGLECHDFHVFYKVVPPAYSRPYPDFKDCEFNDNTQEGILLYDSSPRINYCDVSDNGLWGMKCDDDSDPTLGYVTLTGNGCGGKDEGPPASAMTSGGLYATGTSCPMVCDGAVSGSYSRGYNTITGNCSTGVSAHSNSAPKLGKGLFSKGENSIYNNSEWEIYNNTGSTVYAEYNWWNDEDGPSLLKMCCAYPSNPDWDPWLTEAPSKSGRRGKAHILSQGRQAGPMTPGEYNELGTLYLLQLEYDQAIEAFEYVLTNFSDTPEANYALVHLMHCYREGGPAAQIGPYLSDVTLNSDNEQLQILARYMTISQQCRVGQYESALSTIATLLATDCDEEVQKSAKFREGMIYRYDLNNNAAAIEAFEEFIENYPDDLRAPLAQLELDILGVDQIRRVGPQEKAVVADANLPGEYALYPNYPNPFNAQTCIQYQLPKATKVFLAIYNVLGQRVNVLADDLRPAGRYRVIWDGRDSRGLEVASGIYFARLQAGEFSVTKKMVLIR